MWKEAAAVINSDKPQWEQERFARAVDALLHKKQQVEFVPNPRSNSPQFVQGAPKAVLASDKTKVSATFAIGSVALPAPKDTSPVLKEQSRPISSVSKLSESLRDSPPPAGSCKYLYLPVIK